MAETSKPVRRKRRARRDGPHPVDVHVGSRIRQRRILLGMSQSAIAGHLGLTFQQVQKNERGANRVGSSRLFELSRILDVPVEYFFDDMTPETASATSVEGLAEVERDPVIRRETLELVRAYYRITDPRVRESVYQLTKVLGKTVRGR